MNFSNTKKLRKILSLATAIVMVSTLFTGCMKKEPVETDPPLLLETEPSDIPETTAAPTEPEEINENMATVLSQMNVRSSPSEGATVLGTLNAGDKVEVVQTQDPLGVVWGYIVSPMTGWICMDFVEWDYKPSDNTPNETPTEPDASGEDEDPLDKLDKDEPNEGNGSSDVLYTGSVTASELNIRKSASTSAEKVGTLKNGTRVEILEKKGNWGRIEQGWINLDHVKLNSGSTSGGSNNNNNNNNSNSGSSSSGNGSTKVISKGIVNTENLNIREEPDAKSDKLGNYSFGDRVEILEKSNGWGRTSKGWIALNYVYIDGTGTGNNRKGEVTASELNIRSGPGTTYSSVGSLNEGDEVTILFRVDRGDGVWGNIKQGWIRLDYVDLEGDDDDWDDEDKDDEDDKDYDDDDVEFRGIVTAKGLNIRKKPDSDSESVGTYNYGHRVEILEEEDGWGRTNKGWISLKYVYEDGTGDGGDYGYITGDNVNIRSGPGKNYAVVGSLDYDDEVTILFELKVGDTTWGNIKEGWISMDYVELD